MNRFEPNLRIPGPTTLPPSVREAGARQMINHRGPEFAAMLGRILARMKPYFGTTSDVAMLSCAGSGGLEAAVVNTLSPGDRVLGVPAWTGSVNASWFSGPWTASLAGYRASDWIDYDRVALTRDALSGYRTAWQLTGPALRSYWKHYDGVSHLRFSASREFNHGLSLLFTGDNLLNYQVGEPDNITVLPGRSFTLGVRAAF